VSDHAAFVVNKGDCALFQRDQRKGRRNLLAPLKFDLRAQAERLAGHHGKQVAGLCGADCVGHRVFSSIRRAIASAEMTYTRPAHTTQGRKARPVNFHRPVARAAALVLVNFHPGNDNRPPPAGWASLENV
jgi:hypothetical protein